MFDYDPKSEQFWVAFEQLDDVVGCIFVPTVLEKPRKKRT